jgi:MazG family protein
MRELQQLLDIMARLREPERGCPWDREQSFASIAPYTIEEAYEVAEAIAEGDREQLKDELGDLLLQVVFHAQMAREEGAFDFADVARAISEKLIRRHPHVFGDVQYSDAVEQRAAWEAIKSDEQRARGTPAPPSALAGVPLALPALTRALKLQRKAARVGFEWQAPAPILAKINEELQELCSAMAEQAGAERLHEELGDLLFACVNLARHLELDPEAALREANRKFERRFRRIEARLAENGQRPEQVSLAALEALWQRAKTEE